MKQATNLSDSYLLSVSSRCAKQEDGELWVFLKFKKSPLTVSLVYSTS